MAAIDDIEPVQTPIHYSPNVRFCAFDLATIDGAGEGTFMSYRRAVALFESIGIPVAPTLRTGKLDELLAHRSTVLVSGFRTTTCATCV